MKLILAATSLLLATLTFAGVATAQGPGLDVCWKGHNASDCYGGHDFCVTYSYQVPQCLDMPTCTGAICDPTGIVGVCVHENMCDGGHDVCVWYGKSPPLCFDYFTCACKPLE